MVILMTSASGRCRPQLHRSLAMRYAYEPRRAGRVDRRPAQAPSPSQGCWGWSDLTFAGRPSGLRLASHASRRTAASGPWTALRTVPIEGSSAIQGHPRGVCSQGGSAASLAPAVRTLSRAIEPRSLDRRSEMSPGAPHGDLKGQRAGARSKREDGSQFREARAVQHAAELCRSALRSRSLRRPSSCLQPRRE